MRRSLLLGAMLFVLIIASRAYGQDPEMNDRQPANTEGADFQRGIDNIANRGNEEGWDPFERWGAVFFGDRTFDPLASDAEHAQVQAINEGVGDRAETGAEFVDAATDLVDGALPAPTAGAGAALTVVEEAAEDAAAEEPGIVGQIVNAIGNFFSAVGEFFSSDDPE